MTRQDEATVGRPPIDGIGVVAFGDFTLDAARALLKRGKDEVRLRSQSFDVLLYLVTHRGRVVPKEELLNAIWGSVRVTDDSVVQCIKEIRAAMGDVAQQIIKTVPRRGYLFDAPVDEVQGNPRRNGRRGAADHQDGAAARLPVRCPC